MPTGTMFLNFSSGKGRVCALGSRGLKIKPSGMRSRYPMGTATTLRV